MTHCKDCTNEIKEHQSYFNCDFCKDNYHSHCKAIHGANIKRLAALKTWKCSDTCEKKMRSPTTSKTPSHNLQTVTNLRTHFTNQFNELRDFIKDQVSNVMDKMRDLQQSQEFISTHFDEWNGKMNNIITENQQLKLEITNLRNRQNHHEKIINNIEAETDVHKQNEIKNNIIISGLSKTNISSTTQIIEKILDKLNVNPQIKNEIEDVQVISKNDNNNSVISIKLKSNAAKKEIMNKKSTKRSLTVQELDMSNTNEHLNNLNLQDNQIFFRDQLTQYQLQLFRASKELKIKYSFKYLWFKNNTLLIRKTDVSKVHKIISKNDIIFIENLCTPLEPIIHNNNIEQTNSSTTLDSTHNSSILPSNENH